MENSRTIIDRSFGILLSEKTKRKSEKVIVTIAIICFFIHLIGIYLKKFGWISIDAHPELFSSPIAAIYTPFSFILLYEAYLLVYYLPKSTSFYIAKQYEIITLIVIRRIFKDLSNLEFTEDWFSVSYDLQFTYDLIATIFLFFLIYLFYRLNANQNSRKEALEKTPETEKFILRKKIISILLVPIFLVLAVYSLFNWVYRSFSLSEMVDTIMDINEIFFDEFFGILILTDVFLLLISFFYIDRFSLVIRNSGFVISTILIKLSFGTEGILNTALIVVAVLFGVIVLWAQNLYAQIEPIGD
ncbi:hypothetical protein O3Q51_08545 [Cryomorphaceae bacterium 1068]|nr:hypothetical protein [Cryomorphaceae bacterium 1068]